MPDDQANPVVPQPGADSPTTTPQPSDAASQALTIDGTTYTADQVRELAKTKTDYGQLQSEFTRRSQLLTNPDQLLEYARKTYPDRFPTAAPVTPSDEEKQLAEAEKILRGRGFTTKEEAQQLIRDEMAQREADAFVKSEAEKLSNEWDGKDGKPKFDIKEVAQFAVDNHFPNLTVAFKMLKENDLRAYFASQKPNPKAPVIAGPGGNNAPVKRDKPVRLDDDSFDKAFDEMVGTV